MGYQIVYEGAASKREVPRFKIPKKKVILTTLVAILTAALLSWPAGRMWIRNLFLPGNADVTAAALSGLVNDISAGKTVGEAVHTFCVEIINGDA